MEYVSGVNLNQRLSGGLLSSREVVHIGVQLAMDLQAAHNEGVIHRDLKPSNLRITHDHRLKILDFGLAKLIKSTELNDTQTDSFDPGAGTLPYMAPERLDGHGSDVRSDIYSAGAVLYELVAGRRIFFDYSGTQLINAILTSIRSRSLNMMKFLASCTTSFARPWTKTRSAVTNRRENHELT